MSHSRVVNPGLERLHLSDGDFVDVSRELNAGEYYDMLIAQADRQPFAKILAYVVGWSFIGLDGQPLPYSLELNETVRRSTVRALDKATVRELIAALDKHEKTEDAKAAEKKTVQPTASTSSGPSSSASGSG
jgi:hypothetical protein